MVVDTAVSNQDEGQRCAGTPLRGLTAPVPDARQHVPLEEQINNDSRPTAVNGTTDKVPPNEKKTHMMVLRQDGGGRLLKA